ncbi:hypothetical protein F7230_03965 [Corynebacterium sp. 320]|uniref:hypothetical protein n=1 Tax=Corynebacterium TaxID=1716 RepID=UPI00125CC157|nr:MULTISPECIES: hypothetical protein [Corynebacterium]KAB1504244.1 hypothetical protein F7230_03965 [Corynebacterium sp. 320]KAB1552656.1 hypothetical protein F7233_02625 [Corynebacterium sp. 321]KAB1554126.1 hypothetical protein F7232_03960 [Corynebacterium sp. 319]KAB3528380.1 hypothetical protein F8354_03965 [Corynebacterium sp. 250]KAB3540130.1 hypothetical protein F8390_02370 [Corynebacterium sp. 366]
MDKMKRSTYLFVDDLVGNRVMVTQGHTVTLGRASEFRVGHDDPAMHRAFLHVWCDHGMWMIRNVGSFLSATIQPSLGGTAYSPVRLSPGVQWPLPAGVNSILFATKNMRYELEVTVVRPVQPVPRMDVPVAPLTTDTFSPNREQQQVLAALAAPLHRDPSASPRIAVPSVADLARQLGWGEKKTSQKIQHMAETLNELGVPEFQQGVNVPWRIVLARFAAENPQFYA